MPNPSTDPLPVSAGTQAQPVTNPNTSNAPLGAAVRTTFGRTPGIPGTPTPITPVRATVPGRGKR
jgi:hypothetical protein